MSNGFTNQFESDSIRPVRRMFSGTPIFNKHEPIAFDGKNYTTLRCWAYPPNIQYPTVSCFLSFGNAKGSCFAKCTLDDINQILEVITAWRDELQNILPQYQATEETIREQLKKMTEAIEAQKMFTRMSQGDDHDGS